MATLQHIYKNNQSTWEGSLKGKEIGEIKDYSGDLLLKLLKKLHNINT